MRELPRVWISARVELGPLELLNGKAVVQVRDQPLPCPREEYLAEIQDADVVVSCMHSPPFDEEVAAATRGRLKGFVSRSVGVNHVDLELATNCGIPCTNTPGVLVKATAAQTVGLIIAGTRLWNTAQQMAPNDWLMAQATLVGQPIYHKTLGIIGLGPIGQLVARTMRLGFGMRVIYWSRNRKPELERELDLEYRCLDHTLRAADIVSLHCALTPETQRIIGASELALMKPTATLVNVARGALVDQPALIHAVDERRIFGAALDTTDPEPPAADDPILHNPRIYVTPHIGSGDVESRLGMTRLAVENALDILEGRRPRSLLNPAVYDPKEVKK